MVDVALRSGLWLILGGWIGASAYFALVVALAAFRVLPSSALAGQVVDAVYTPLQLYGVGAGIVLAGFASALRRSRWLVVHPLKQARDFDGSSSLCCMGRRPPSRLLRFCRRHGGMCRRCPG